MRVSIAEEVGLRQKDKNQAGEEQHEIRRNKGVLNNVDKSDESDKNIIDAVENLKGVARGERYV